MSVYFMELLPPIGESRFLEDEKDWMTVVTDSEGDSRVLEAFEKN